MSTPPTRIAMWSGPRNISTALMRAWENRPDTTVVDEPLYAYYLARTGLDHPGAADIIAHYPTDWRTVTAWLTGPIPDGRAIWYQKHMTHHILPEMDLDWLTDLTHCFLIRTPEEMIASYIKVRPDPVLGDFGLVEQRRIFDHVRALTGHIPPVVDAASILVHPERTLSLVCDRLGVPFRREMLTWPAGPRPSDGIWARYWYAAVEASTGFTPPQQRAITLPDHLRPLLAECHALYADMAAHRIA